MAKKCQCGAPLKEGETICPACKSKKDRETKTKIGIGAALVAVAAFVVKAALGGKGSGNQA